jgi:hypothetical protein
LEAEIRRFTAESQPRQIVPKTTSALTRVEAVAQLIKCLPRKYEALSSNPSTTKNY